MNENGGKASSRVNENVGSSTSTATSSQRCVTDFRRKPMVFVCQGSGSLYGKIFGKFWPSHGCDSASVPGLWQ